MSINFAVLLGAVAIGLSLGLLGSGGSILTVPVLIFIADQQEKVAIASSLFIVGSIALVGAYPYFNKQLIHWRTVLLFGLPGMFGTYFGASLSIYMSGANQLVLFAVVMLLASYFMIKPSKLNVSAVKTQKKPYQIIMAGLTVSILTGLVGVGGGFLIVPALVLLVALPMRTAIGTSLVIITINSYSGFIKYISLMQATNLALDWSIILSMVIIGGLGTVIGSHIATRVPQEKLKKIFGFFLIFMAIFILYKFTINPL